MFPGSAVVLRLAVKTAEPASPFHLPPCIRHPGSVDAAGCHAKPPPRRRVEGWPEQVHGVVSGVPPNTTISFEARLQNTGAGCHSPIKLRKTASSRQKT
jgi:hypothetical protein